MIKRKKIRLLMVIILLTILLVIISFFSYRLAVETGLGNIGRELDTDISKQKIKEQIPSRQIIETISDLKCYEFSTINHKYINYAFKFTFTDENKDKLLKIFDLRSKPLSGKIIQNTFLSFTYPEWWDPQNVDRGVYFESKINNKNYHFIYDSNSKISYFLIIKMKESRNDN